MSDKGSLVCADCGYSNEPQRIYCHNCGAKLDRATLVQQEQKKKKLTQEQIQKRVRKVMDPKRGFFAGWLSALVKSLVCSILVAGGVQMLREPDGVPKQLSRDELGDYINFGDILYNAARTPISQRVAIKETEANLYLANTVKAKETGLISKEAKFVRAFVAFDEGTVKVTTHESLFDVPLYTSATYTVSTAEGAIQAKCIAGAIGRVPVHPLLMDQLDYFLEPLWEVLKSPKRDLGKMQSIEVHKGEFVIVTPIATPGQPALN